MVLLKCINTEKSMDLYEDSTFPEAFSNAVTISNTEVPFPVPKL